MSVLLSGAYCAGTVEGPLLLYPLLSRMSWDELYQVHAIFPSRRAPFFYECTKVLTSFCAEKKNEKKRQRGKRLATSNTNNTHRNRKGGEDSCLCLPGPPPVCTSMCREKNAADRADPVSTVQAGHGGGGSDGASFILDLSMGSPTKTPPIHEQALQLGLSTDTVCTGSSNLLIDLAGKVFFQSYVRPRKTPYYSTETH